MCVRISSVRRVLQFTPHNAVSCVLHRSAIRVIHRLQSYRLFLELTSATISEFKFSCFVRQRQRLHEPSSSDRSRRNPEAYPSKTRDRTQDPKESIVDIVLLEADARNRHRTKLET